MKFKNLVGSYQAPSVDGEQPVVYPEGSVFESKLDLAKRFNDRRVTKFKRMPDDAELFIAERKAASDVAPVEEPPEDDVFSGMTIAELQEEAKEAGIDLGKAKTKKDILKVLREVTTGLA